MASRIVRTPDGPKIQADPTDWYAGLVVALDVRDDRKAEFCARALLHVATPFTPTQVVGQRCRRGGARREAPKRVRRDETRRDHKDKTMPKLNEMFPSKWLKADDLPEEGVVVTITGIEAEEIGQGREKDDKWVLMFKELEKGLVLNKTNTNILAKLYGDDTDDWEGKLITLYPTECEYKGDMVACIRVKTKAPKPVAKAAAGNGKAKAAKAAAEEAAAEDDDDDTVPF